MSVLKSRSSLRWAPHCPYSHHVISQHFVSITQPHLFRTTTANTFPAHCTYSWGPKRNETHRMERNGYR